MIRRPPRSTQSRSSAASDVYKRQVFGVAHGELGEDLAVELDLSQLQTVHELVVREAVLAGPCVDADDPQLAELTLAHATVAVGVLAAALHLLLGAFVAGVLGGAVALRLLEHLAALLARVDATFDTRHGPYSLALGRPLPGAPAGRWIACVDLAQSEQALDPFGISLTDVVHLAEAPLALGALVLQEVALHPVAADQLTRARETEALLGRAVGLCLRHAYLPPATSPAPAS